MAASNRYGIYTSSVNTGSAVNFTQVKQWNVRTGANKTRVIPGGNVDPSATMLTFADSTVTMTTEDLSTVFANVSISTGLSCTAGATFRLQQRTTGGTFTGGANNVTYTSTVGFLRLSRLSSRQDDDGAEAELTYHPHWDGSTEPLVRNTGVTYTSLTPTFVSKYFLGPIYVNGVIVNGITSVTIDPGIDYNTFRHSGETYARRGSIMTRLPTISFDMLEADSAVLGTAFNAALAGTVAVYFQQSTDGGSRTAAASAVHTKVSATAGSWNTDNVSVSHPQDGTLTVTIQPSSVLAAVTNSAIP